MRLLILIVFMNFFGGPAPLLYADEYTLSLPKNSVLQDFPSAEELDKYRQPFELLSERAQWRMRIHGLRLAALDPRVWASLKRERTENRRLVPIKRFFLRASEVRGFELRSVKLSFRFKAVKANYMAKMRHQKDPIFEIGFGGTFEEREQIDPPLTDRSYALRLSAFPELPSGLLLRDQERFTLLQQPKYTTLVTGKRYEVVLSFTSDKMDATINGEPFIHYSNPAIASGLVSLQTSWHPIVLDTLEIHSRNPSHEHSGLIAWEKK